MENLQREIEKLKNRSGHNPPSISKTAEIMSEIFAKYVANQAYAIFQDKKFQELAGLGNVSQLEKDRIFNELVLAGLVLVMFILEAPDLRVEEIFKDYYQMVKGKISQAYIKQLKKLGVENNYLKDWEKLIAMRYEEYSVDKLKVREAAMEFEAKEEKLDLESLEGIQLVLPLQTVAIGCHRHICRGKTEDKGELFKIILRWLGRCYLDLRVPIEGGKITLWRKFKRKIYHWLHKFI